MNIQILKTALNEYLTCFLQSWKSNINKDLTFRKTHLACLLCLEGYIKLTYIYIYINTYRDMRLYRSDILHETGMVYIYLLHRM